MPEAFAPLGLGPPAFPPAMPAFPTARLPTCRHAGVCSKPALCRAVNAALGSELFTPDKVRCRCRCALPVSLLSQPVWLCLPATSPTLRSSSSLTTRHPGGLLPAAGGKGPAGRHRAGAVPPALPRPRAEPAGGSHDGPPVRRRRAQSCPSPFGSRSTLLAPRPRSTSAPSKHLLACRPFLPACLQPQALPPAVPRAAGPPAAPRHLLPHRPHGPRRPTAQCGARHAASPHCLVIFNSRGAQSVCCPGH